MIKRKKKKPIHIRKNPYENRPEYFGYVLGILTAGYDNIEDYLNNFSLLLSYRNTGIYCEDCDNDYRDCTCEGSRIVQGSPCEYCNKNYCICDYDLNTIFDVIKEVVNLAIKDFPKSEIIQLIAHLEDDLRVYKIKLKKAPRHEKSFFKRKILNIEYALELLIKHINKPVIRKRV